MADEKDRQQRNTYHQQHNRALLQTRRATDDASVSLMRERTRLQFARV